MAWVPNPYYGSSTSTPLRGPTPQNQIAPGVIRVPNPYYGSSTSTQPQYMEFISTPGFPQYMEFQLQDFQSSDACLNYVFGLVSLILFGLV